MPVNTTLIITCGLIDQSPQVWFHAVSKKYNIWGFNCSNYYLIEPNKLLNITRKCLESTVGKILGKRKKKKLSCRAQKYSKDFLLESVEAQLTYFLLYTVCQITDIPAFSTTTKNPMTRKTLASRTTDSCYLQNAA